MARTATTPRGRAARTSRSRLDILRWQAGCGTFNVPQAAAPIAFALIALPLTGTAESGAALVLAMTAAQVLGAVPVARIGRRFNGVRYLRALIGVRALALAAVTLLAAARAPFALVVVAVVAAGVVNGAAYGYMRLLLNYLVEPAGLPRALGVAATLTEVSFALSPVLASLLGAVSPAWTMAVVTVLGLGPLVLMPSVPEARGLQVNEVNRARTRVPRAVFLWLFCASASGSAAAAVEVGAVPFALAFGLDPGWAFLFALTLCVGSVMGGIWVSVRNRKPTPRRVVAFLAAMATGSALVLTGGHLAVTLAGAAVVGLFLPMLSTFYSLALDELSPPGRRAEMFALQRTASSLGIIAISGLLALLGLRAALTASLALLLTACALAAAHVARTAASGAGPGPGVPDR
ncbi:Major Facilitator Superfamily protein [Streptomyces zhaozhouensis]|uniref:Major Facilitator Superfamily protein n=1 Tax=Streptomyces zhaozhouensis TaxID=1300267 RepID=A0A286E0I6_9ACTN|nr:MFS transporter [Streptomyces zhaozhouensis]SOD64419.1 Major Facilitator Superfamily protein [Streptomyces zhaozhouensis]